MQGVFLRQLDILTLSFTSFFVKLDEMLFTPQFDTYEHLTFLNDPNGFKWLILGIYFGLVLASAVMFYNKNVLGSLIRRLDGAQAYDRATAKTLSELGCDRNIFFRLSLKAGNSLRRVISVAPREDERLPDDINLYNAAALGRKCSPLTDRFYLPQSKRDATVTRFNAKGSGWLSVILMVVVGFVAVIAIFKLAPFVAGLIEQAIAGMVSGQ